MKSQYSSGIQVSLHSRGSRPSSGSREQAATLPSLDPRRLTSSQTTHQQARCHLSFVMSDQIQATIREADCNIMLFIAGVSVGHKQQEVPGEELQERKKNEKDPTRKKKHFFPCRRSSWNSHFVTSYEQPCTSPVTSFQMVINPPGPRDTLVIYNLAKMNIIPS